LHKDKNPNRKKYSTRKFINLPSPKIKLIIVDDHPVVRRGLMEIINQDPAFEVVGQSGKGMDLLPLLKETSADIVILDISLPDISGLEVLQLVQLAHLKTKFIIMTMYKDEEFIAAATRLDVRGYLFKDNTPTELLKCLHTVSKDKIYFSPEVSGQLVTHIQSQEKLHQQYPALKSLTSAQRKILRLIAENKTSREIADKLFLSVRTVQNQRNKICQKLGLSGYHKLMEFAFRHKSLL